MIYILGNFAGVFSNVCKFLLWSILLKEEDTLLFYYTNKGLQNDNHRVLPYHEYEKELGRIFFYKYFEFPKGHAIDSFLSLSSFEMNYPSIQSSNLPTCLQPYPNGFVFCSPNVYKDPHFSEIRKLFHEHIQRRLQFTESFRNVIEEEAEPIRRLQAQGKKILAVFLRSTSHFQHYNTTAVFEEIQEVMKDYDYILPITQIGPFLKQTYDMFGERCIVFKDRIYFSEDKDWIQRLYTDEEFEVEFKNAILDVYLASQCDFIMGGSSNMFLGALFFNPTVPYKMFQELKGKDGM